MTDLPPRPDLGRPELPADRSAMGNTAVLDVLVSAGARIENLVQAAAAGDVSGHL